MNAVAVVAQSGNEFSPKDPGASEFFFWDFTAELSPGETLVSAVVKATSQVDGSDNSAAMVPRSAIVLNGNVVKQLISAGTLATKYQLTAYGTTMVNGDPSLGQVLPLSAILEIAAEFGVVT